MITGWLWLVVALPAADAAQCLPDGRLRLTHADLDVVFGPELWEVRLPGGSLPPTNVVTEELVGTVVGSDGVAVPFVLQLGERWRLQRGTAAVELGPPRGWPAGAEPQVLVRTQSAIWLGAPGVVVELRLAEDVVRVGRLSWGKSTPLTAGTGEPISIWVGSDLFRCPHADECVRVARLPGRVEAVIPFGHGRLLAVAGVSAGVYREEQEATPRAIVLGTVVALCGTPDQAWALLVRGDESRILVLDRSSPVAQTLTLADAFSVAGSEDTAAPPAAVARLLGVARAERWPALATLALPRVADPSSEIRVAVAAAMSAVPGVQGTAALYLLAHDPEASVRLETVAAAARRCEREGGPQCAATLTWFLGDADTEVAWEARDLLLEHDPERALAGAPRAYKLEAIPALVARIERDVASRSAEVLARLAVDADLEVSETARLALDAVLP